MQYGGLLEGKATFCAGNVAWLRLRRVLGQDMVLPWDFEIEARMGSSLVSSPQPQIATTQATGRSYRACSYEEIFQAQLVTPIDNFRPDLARMVDTINGLAK